MIELEHFIQFFEPIFNHLAADSAGSIRALTVKAVDFSCIQRFPQGPIIKKLMPFFDDPAWQIRCEIAIHLILLRKMAGPVSFRDHLLPAWRKLLKDTDKRVITAAQSNGFKFFGNWDEEARLKVLLQILEYQCTLVEEKKRN